MPFPSGYTPPQTESLTVIEPEVMIPVSTREIPTFAIEEPVREVSFSLESFISLLDTHIMPIMAAILLVGFLRVIYRYYHRQELYLQKLWLFVVFFLSKRQLMIPLVYTLSGRDHLLSDAQRARLLELRQECQESSLKEHPVERIKREQELSRLLYTYFMELEKQNKIIAGTPVERLVKDLEFMDEKLLDLQKTYNQEVETWNTYFHRLLPGVLLKLFRFHRFHLFDT